MRRFEPRREILPAAQQRLWGELSCVPQDFVLYGETALALRLGHRNSVDFDLFSNRPLNIPALESELAFLRGAKVIQREPNTLTVIVERGGPVKVSFFGVPNLPRLMPPDIVEDNGLQVASLIDLAGTKASVVQVRAEAKDYIDIGAIMSLGNLSLPHALAAAQRLYGSAFNPEITLKALSYFDDGDLRELPDQLKGQLAAAVRGVDLDRLPSLDQSFRKGTGSDIGL